MIKNNLKFVVLLVSIIMIFIAYDQVLAVAADGGPPTQTGSLPSGSPKSNTNPDISKYENINSTSFKLLICDGPPELVHYDPKNRVYSQGYTNPDFIPCYFRGLMLQIQHLINLAFVLAVLATIIGMIRAGYLYITGVPANLNKAHEIFKAVGIGFVLALCAWFIVYQILVWLTGSGSYTALLGL